MGNCLVDTCCCEHNWIIFPAPRSHVGWDFKTQIIENNQSGGEIKIQLHADFFNNEEEKVPYIEVSSQKSRKKDEAMIYFHGNAEDIFHAIDFVLPIFKSTQITVYILEYPTYSCYQTEKKYFVSNRIKSNSVQFHKLLQQKYPNLKPKNIYIVGRSIGSGPAAFLASEVDCSKLVLISPFDTIKKVARGLVGCIGIVVKDHFSNQEAIVKHKGELLVIHGRMDQVINFNHGKNLVEIYEKTDSNRKCIFVQPVRMSHNDFQMRTDIVNPIKSFLTNKSQI